MMMTFFTIYISVKYNTNMEMSDRVIEKLDGFILPIRINSENYDLLTSKISKQAAIWHIATQEVLQNFCKRETKKNKNVT